MNELEQELARGAGQKGKKGACSATDEEPRKDGWGQPEGGDLPLADAGGKQAPLAMLLAPAVGIRECKPVWCCRSRYMTPAEVQEVLRRLWANSTGILGLLYAVDGSRGLTRRA